MTPLLSFDPIDRLLFAEHVGRCGAVTQQDRGREELGLLRCEDVGVRIGAIRRFRNTEPAVPTTRMIRHWRRDGIDDPWLADRIATAVGWPASLLWDEYDDLIDAACEKAARKGRRRPVAA